MNMVTRIQSLGDLDLTVYTEKSKVRTFFSSAAGAAAGAALLAAVGAAETATGAAPPPGMESKD